MTALARVRRPGDGSFIGSIAKQSREESGTGLTKMTILAEPTSMRAEAIRALRTHVVAQHINGGRRALAVCAPSVGVGCSFIASNLAVGLAQVGIRTLLVDADLRTPTIQNFLPCGSSDNGLRQYLSSADGNFVDSIQMDVLPNLSVMYAGGPASDPQELLASERFSDLVNVCLRDFDATIIDTPPANQCADARRVGNVVGYSLVVARRNESLVDDVKTLIGELQSNDVRVIGTVLTEL